MNYVIVHYHEIGLKGKNRPMFERRLRDNIRASVQGLGVKSVRRRRGRILLELREGASWEPIRERLETIFGIAYFARAFRTPVALERMKEAIIQRVPRDGYETFRVSTRRADKQYPLTSEQINAEIGAAIQAHTGKAVDLGRPDLTVFIELLYNEAFVYFEKIPGPGGLPVGVSGKVVSLLSGGIDSPVAAYHMLKRGCDVLFVHFHGTPFTTPASQRKAIKLVQVLTRYQASPRLYLVPFGEIQRQIMLATPAPYRVILYRRLMGRIAEEIARREGAQALVTGESLGQVASQTLENLAVIEEAVTMPILRPLIGMDKQEIVDRAQAIGTYELSILPGEDCCRLFVPSHPATRATLAEVQRIEARLDMDDLVRWGVQGAEEVTTTEERGERGEGRKGVRFLTQL